MMTQTVTFNLGHFHMDGSPVLGGSPFVGDLVARPLSPFQVENRADDPGPARYEWWVESPRAPKVATPAAKPPVSREEALARALGRIMNRADEAPHTQAPLRHGAGPQCYPQLVVAQPSRAPGLPAAREPVKQPPGLQHRHGAALHEAAGDAAATPAGANQGCFGALRNCFGAG